MVLHSNRSVRQNVKIVVILLAETLVNINVLLAVMLSVKQIVTKVVVVLNFNMFDNES